MPNTETPERSIPDQLRYWADRLTELAQAGLDRDARIIVMNAAIRLGTAAEQLDRQAWTKSETAMMLAALSSYLTKQENNRDQAIRKFGAEARTHGVDERIAI